ncbi:TPA: TM2 domain-containing protein [Streptococcus suis]|nr:TM2 domain-containing protein [Streptococcus suis]
MSQFTDSYLAANASNLPAEALPMLRQRLNELNESQITFVLAAELKSPLTALSLGIFFGGLGVDRFYIGHVGLGVAKLLFGWLTFYIWPLVDLFLIMGATKKANLEKLHQAIMSATWMR